MAPFEAMYGHRCRTLLNWFEPGERTIFGPNLVTEAEDIIHRIQSKRPPGLDKKAMPTRDVDHWSSKQVTVCTFTFHLHEV
jgi:hypothetical protein